MDVQDVVLTANQLTKLGVPGKFFLLIEAPSPVTVQFKNSFSTFRETGRDVEAGYKSFPGDWSDQDDRFDGLAFLSTVNQTIKIGISDRAGDYDRVVGLVDVTPPNDGTTQVDDTAGVASSVGIAANANRRWAHVQNTEPDGGPNCRVGPGVVTATRGIQLRPGQAVRLQTTAAINIIREGAIDVSVGITEETRT